MSLSNTAENDFLKCLLQGTDPSWRAGATFYLALHSSDPGEAGDQTTNEVAYTSYARVALTKASDWTDAGSTFTNANLEQFPTCTGLTATATHFSIGTDASGAGVRLASGVLGSSLAISNGIQPQFPVASLSITID